MVIISLIAAAVSEAVFAIALKESEEFTRLWPSVLCVATVVGDYFLLAYVFRNLPLGTAYVVWTGLSAILIVIYGMFVYGDGVTAARILFLSLTVLGIAGLRYGC